MNTPIYAGDWGNLASLPSSTMPVRASLVACSCRHTSDRRKPS